MEPTSEPPTTPPEEIDQPPTEEDRQARTQFLQRLTEKPKKRRRWPIILIVILLLLAAGAGAYYFKNHKTSAKPATTKKNTSQVAPSSAKSDGSTLNYVSKGSDLNLTFDYPSDWTVTPASGGNSDDKTITLNSPLTTIAGADGTSTTGKVTVSIRPSSAGISELSSGKATAGQASAQFAYTKPSSVQYQYPYLTFIHLAGGSNPKSAFEEVIASGNTTFNKDDSITQDSLSPDPIISATFYACSTTACASGAGATPLGITNDTWTNADVFKQTLALFESLTIQ